MTTKVRHWLRGMAEALISGSTTSILSFLGIAGADAVGFSVPTLNWKQVGAIALSGAFVRFVTYLNRNPLPPEADNESETTTMKKISSALFVAILAFAVTACVNVQRSDGTTAKVPDVPTMCAVAKSATFLGTRIYLNGLGSNVPAHPEDREQFLLARKSLRALIAAGSFSAADLSATLKSLPVEELQGEEGTLLIGEAVVLWDSYGVQLARLDKAKVFDTYILPVAKAILTGLDMALGPET